MALLHTGPVASRTAATDGRDDDGPPPGRTATRPVSAAPAAGGRTASPSGDRRADRFATDLVQRRSHRYRALSGAGIIAVIIMAAATASDTTTTPSTWPTAGGTCHSDVVDTVLPTWARYGFGDPEPRVPHAVSDHGRIAGILFGGLYAPPAGDERNKILWVSHTGADGPLVIDAVRAGSAQHVRREVTQGPGPSHVDLPAPGCWQLQLRWGSAPDQRDSLSLVYSSP
jgi:hypothetical protein